MIMAGIEDVEGEAAKACIYVGMSRARAHLTVVVNERLGPELDELNLLNEQRILGKA